MTDNRPTFIAYSSPDSERSIYFDAPLMHIFSKHSDADGEEGHVAPSPDQSRLRTTTSLSNSQAGAREEPMTMLDDPNAFAQPLDEGHSTSEGEDTVLSRDYGPSRVLNNNLPRQRSASNPGGTAPDSGYGSPTPRKKQLQTEDDMQPIPVVWGGELGQNTTKRQSKMSAATADPRRSQSMRSYRSSGTNRDAADTQSMRATPSGRYTPAQHARMTSSNGGAFADGAGTVGPAATPDPEETNLFRSRSVSAESALSKKQKLRISKDECEYSVLLHLSRLRS